MDSRDLAFLVDKYERMLALRRENDAARGGAALPEAHRLQMRELATLAPGSLRELDRRSTEEIEARLGELRDAVTTRQESGKWASWMSVSVTFHRELKKALEERRVKGCSSSKEDASEASWSRARLVPGIVERIAKEALLDEADVMRLLFGPR